VCPVNLPHGSSSAPRLIIRHRRRASPTPGPTTGDTAPVDTHILRLRTGDRLVTDLTAEVLAFCRGKGDGLCHVFVPHATAGVALVETGSGTEPDLAAALERLLPRADIYRHRHGSLGHGRDHVVPADLFGLLA